MFSLKKKKKKILFAVFDASLICFWEMMYHISIAISDLVLDSLAIVCTDVYRLGVL